jgi:hypothetical protein
MLTAAPKPRRRRTPDQIALDRAFRDLSRATRRAELAARAHINHLIAHRAAPEPHPDSPVGLQREFLWHSLYLARLDERDAFERLFELLEIPPARDPQKGFQLIRGKATSKSLGVSVEKPPAASTRHQPSRPHSTLRVVSTANRTTDPAVTANPSTPASTIW